MILEGKTTTGHTIHEDRYKCRSTYSECEKQSTNHRRKIMTTTKSIDSKDECFPQAAVLRDDYYTVGIFLM